MLFKLINRSNGSSPLASINDKTLCCVKKIDFSWRDGDGEPKIDIEFDREAIEKCIAEGCNIEVDENGYCFMSNAVFDRMALLIAAVDDLEREGFSHPQTMDDVDAHLSRLRSFREERIRNLTLRRDE